MMETIDVVDDTVTMDDDDDDFNISYSSIDDANVI